MTSRLLVVIVHNLRVTVQFQFLVVREYMFNDLRADTDINDVIVHRERRHKRAIKIQKQACMCVASKDAKKRLRPRRF